MLVLFLLRAGFLSLLLVSRDIYLAEECVWLPDHLLEEKLETLQKRRDRSFVEEVRIIVGATQQSLCALPEKDHQVKIGGVLCSPPYVLLI